MPNVKPQGEHLTDFWTRKPRAGWDAYWQTLHEPYRDALVEALERLPPFTSLLELGCGPGVNLWRIQERFPDVTLGGFDLSPEAIDSAHERFRQAERNGTLRGAGEVYLAIGALPMSLAEVQPADVLLSCYTLAYTPPRLIAETLQAMTTLARQAIVLAEPMCTVNEYPVPAGILTRQIKQQPPIEFAHDYRTWFVEQAGPEWRITTFKPLVVDRMNRLLVAQRRNS